MNVQRELIIFSFDFPPSDGGIARLCQEIAVGMKPYYKKVQVLTRGKQGQNEPYNINEVEIVSLPNRRVLCDLSAIIYLSKIENKRNFDIICGTWHPEAALSLIAGFKNIFILGHGTELIGGNSFFRKNLWLKYYGKVVLDKARLTITNSHYTKNLIYNISKEANCIDLPLGVNHEFFKPISNLKENNQVFKICTVSRIEKFKGHDFIAKVLVKIPVEYRNRIEWNIAGTGNYLNELTTTIDNLGIQDIVKFHGFVKDSNLPIFYNKNDLFILPTREDVGNINVEGFGLVFLEAQSCGIPVIGTKTGGISDAIKEKNGGWLIEQDNEKVLYDLLISFLNDKTQLEQEGAKARKRVEESCTWKIYCSKLFKMIEG